MKIKCPFCKSVYDPEACDSQCPSCNRRLLVPVRRNIKKDVAEETYQRVVNQKTGVIVLSKSPSETGKVPASKPVTGPITPPAPAAKPAPVPVPAVSKDPPTLFIEKPHVPAPAPDIVLKPPTKPISVSTPASETFTRLNTAPAPQTEIPVKAAAPAVVPKAEREVFIGLRKPGAKEWETVFRIPVNVFKIATLVPKAATQVLLDHGIDILELRKAIDHTDLIGKLLEIETTQNRVIVAIEPPKGC